MDRTEYLKLCQQVSMFTATHRQIPLEMLVKHAEIVYYPYGYKMIFNKGIAQNIAVLHDLRANTIMEADLERIKKNEKAHL